MDILNFNPSQLSNFGSTEKTESNENSLIYKARPAESKAEDGVYRSTIKVIYNPFEFSKSIVSQQSYAMMDDKGFFQVVSSLTNGDTNCPIFKAWKTCHYEKNNMKLHLQAETKENGGKGLFDKRFARYVTIQVIEDKNHPELEGNYMFWKMPKCIWDMIQNKMTPAPESRKAPIPVMDFLVGRAIELEVTPGPDDPAHPERKTREISYASSEISDDIISCTNPDGSSLLTDAQQKVLDTYIEMMSNVWKEKNPEKRAEIQAKVNADNNTKEFAKFYSEEILPAIKSFCPNIVEHLGYKPWSPEVEARVNNWISIVLQGNDPATPKFNSTATEDQFTSIVPPVVTAPESNTITSNYSSSIADDDIPF